jgi:hypothetical protein
MLSWPFRFPLDPKLELVRRTFLPDMRQEIFLIFLAGHVVVPRETSHSQLISLFRKEVEVVQHGSSVLIDEFGFFDGIHGAVPVVMTIVVGLTVLVFATAIFFAHARRTTKESVEQRKTERGESAMRKYAIASAAAWLILCGFRGRSMRPSHLLMKLDRPLLFFCDSQLVKIVRMKIESVPVILRGIATVKV